jgi:hypothetical protein
LERQEARKGGINMTGAQGDWLTLPGLPSGGILVA